jgi:hypothetical protein
MAGYGNGPDRGGSVGSSLRVGEDRDRLVELPAAYLHAEGIAGQPSVVHGYAATGHVHQGATADATLVLGSPELYREWIYTAASRPRDQLRFYLTDTLADSQPEFHGAERSPPDAVDAFVRQAHSSEAQIAASDRGIREQVAGLSLPDLRAERDRLERLIQPASGPRLQRELASANAELADTQRVASAASTRRAELELHRDQARRRERRALDIEVKRAAAIEHEAHFSVGAAAERVHEIRAQIASDRWPVDHADTLVRYAAVRDELADRDRAALLRVRHLDVPEYLTAELGDRPTAPRARGMWDRAAVRIEHYRSSLASPIRPRRSASVLASSALAARSTKRGATSTQPRLASTANTRAPAPSRPAGRPHCVGGAVSAGERDIQSSQPTDQACVSARTRRPRIANSSRASA